MFIKVKTEDGLEILVNKASIERVIPCLIDHKDCALLYFGRGEVLRTITLFGEIQNLLDVDSIEKRIEKIKAQNLALRQKMQYDEIFANIYGGKREK